MQSLYPQGIIKNQKYYSAWLRTSCVYHNVATMKRRMFITASTSTIIAGFAGCTDLLGSNRSPEGTVEAFLAAERNNDADALSRYHNEDVEPDENLLPVNVETERVSESDTEVEISATFENEEPFPPGDGRRILSGPENVWEYTFRVEKIDDEWLITDTFNITAVK